MPQIHGKQLKDTSITLAKVENIASARIVGRVTGGSGVPETLTGTQATTLLDAFTSGLKGLTPASGGGTTNFLRADGAWANPVSGIVGVTDGDKGDITVSASGATWTIDAGVVTYAKMQNISVTDRLLGRDTAGAGSAQELTVSGGIEFTGAGGIQRSALTGDVTASAGSGATTIANNAVTLAKMADIATARILGRVTAATGDPEALTGTQATTLLDVFTSVLKGLAPSSGGGTTNFLRADGTWTAPPSGGVTLDGAYDFGGAHAGRTINVDSGFPVELSTQSIGEAIVVGLDIVNPTAAANNAQQYSPSINLRGSGWAAGSSANRTVDFLLQVRPVQGAESTVGQYLRISSAHNSGGYGHIGSFFGGIGGGDDKKFLMVNPAGDTAPAFAFFDSQDSGLGVNGSGNPVLIDAGTQIATVSSTGVAVVGVLTASGNISTSGGSITAFTDITATFGDIDAIGGFRRGWHAYGNISAANTTYYVATGAVTADHAGVWFYVPRSGSITNVRAWFENNVVATITFYVEKALNLASAVSDSFSTMTSFNITSGNRENGTNTGKDGSAVFTAGNYLRIRAVTNSGWTSQMLGMDIEYEF